MPRTRRLIINPKDFDSDSFLQPAVAVQLQPQANDVEHHPHSHRKGQLILALRGMITCRVPEALWLAPPQQALWIPGGVPHSCRPTKNAQIYFLFAEPGLAAMPDKCCTLSITPLVRELILHLSACEPAYLPETPTARVAAVLLEQLEKSAIEKLNLPTSDNKKIRKIVDTLLAHPHDRSTLSQWAERLATNERSLGRLIEKETGLSFGRWRQQLYLMIALSQLAEGQSVQAIAGHLGYASVNAFITMFKKALGKSPAQYFASICPPS